MASNLISLYRKLNAELMLKLGCHINKTSFSFIQDGETKFLTFEEQEDQSAYYLGTAKEYWDPNIHGLTVERTIILETPSVLFEEDGLTTSKNILGIGAHLFSRTSNFQETVPLEATLDEKSGKTKVFYRQDFLPSSLRGEVTVEVFIYLKEISRNAPYLADQVGLKLGNIDSFKFAVDGEGSMFPINEAGRPGQPLWKLETRWTDINSDSFDSNNVLLELNNKHVMYEQLHKSTRPSRYLLNEILSNVIAQIIFKATEDPSFEPADAVPDSIAQVISYWIKTYEVDISSFESISYSLRKKTEKILGE